MRVAALVAIACLIVCSPARADIFNFSITYDGTNATVDGSSDPVLGASLIPGDTFNLDVHAQGPDYWQVTADTNMIIYASFFVQDSGNRVGNSIATFYLDGVQVAQDTDFGLSQSQIHIGAQVFTLNSGLLFDQLIVNYDFLSTTSTTTIIQNNGLNFTPFYNEPNISYIFGVPEPGSMILLGAFGLAGMLTRRRIR